MKQQGLSRRQFTAGAAALAACAAFGRKLTVQQTPDQRAAVLLRQMTLEEKLDLLSGTEEFKIKGVERLGIPQISMTDGPQGVRDYSQNICYPASVLRAASWDTEIQREVGKAMARDCRTRGHHILLAPAMNIYRDPRCGRNFEYFGEDPFLAGRMASAFIEGVQSEGVLACAKHFAVNNQETDRLTVSAQIDERTLREIYLPAFQASVDAGVGCVMSAYNKVNGEYCTANKHLNLDILRHEWGFKGILMSDWGAVHDTVGPAAAGLDLEMPGADFWTQEMLIQAMREGKITQDAVNTKVLHILTTCIAAGFYDREQKTDTPPNNPKNREAALNAARAGIVLLKNEKGMLPLVKEKIQRLALIGPNVSPPVIAGGGSGIVDPILPTSILQGLQKLLGSQVEIFHLPEIFGSAEELSRTSPWDGSLRQQVYQNRDFQGKPYTDSQVDAIAFNARIEVWDPAGREDDFSVRWTGGFTLKQKTKLRFAVKSDDGIRVFIDGRRVFEEWFYRPNDRVFITEVDRGSHEIKVEYCEEKGEANCWVGFEDADAAIKSISGGQEIRDADAVIACMGFNWRVEGEGFDRTYELPGGQVEMIQAAAAANPRTVVILNAGGGVDWAGWLDRVPALIHSFYAGEEGGNALAEILLGVTNPSGRLPMSMERKLSDNPAYPYFLKPEDLKAGKAVYGEGIMVGCRGYDAAGREPMFPFGFGLSYTTFEMSDLVLDSANLIKVTAKNAGSRAGSTVVQVYTNPPKKSGAKRPPKVLKGFVKVHLEAGESKVVSVELPMDAYSYWHTAENRWVLEHGINGVEVGFSSRDIRLRSEVKLGL